MSGLLAGIIGGTVVAAISGSHTSVSGPAAGLTAIVATRLDVHDGRFEVFLLAVVLAGVIQIAMGAARAGALSSFFPSSVIKGLLAAIGVLLILKQLPHLVGHDADPEGEMSYIQPDEKNTFSELASVFTEGDWHAGAAAIGGVTLILLVVWNRVGWFKRSIIPGPLVVVLVGVAMTLAFRNIGGELRVGPAHLVQLASKAPVDAKHHPPAESARITPAESAPDSPSDSNREPSRDLAASGDRAESAATRPPPNLFSRLTTPAFSAWRDGAVYVTAMMIALVASLETLLNLEAVDKLDRFKRKSPPSRELIAQGVGNVCGGLIGALPVTSVIVRSSVNVNTGAKTKMAAVYHGVLLLGFVALFPSVLELIPKAALATILIVTGFKLASVGLFRQMWNEGRYQFAPFIITLVTIVFTDLLKGVLVGLVTSLLFILNSNLRRPLNTTTITDDPHGPTIRLTLSDQVSFLNRAALDQFIASLSPGEHVLIDGSASDYIDPDILSLLRELNHEAPIRGFKVSMVGFADRYHLPDHN